MKCDLCISCLEGFGFPLVAPITRIINGEDCLPADFSVWLKENWLKEK